MVISDGYVMDQSGEQFEVAILAACAKLNAKIGSELVDQESVLPGMDGDLFGLEVVNNTGIGEIAECQICFDHGEGFGKMIRPCLCLGGRYAVHDQCITKNVELSGQNDYHCIVCKVPYVYKVVEQPLGVARKLLEMIQTAWFQMCWTIICIFLLCQILFPKFVNPYVTLGLIMVMLMQMTGFGYKFWTTLSNPSQLTILDRYDAA